MKLIDYLIKLRDRYVYRQVKRIVLPQVESSKLIREHVFFSGRVQNVGFRYEVFLLARKLGLTGWVKNLKDGSVESMFQGEKNKIDFLIEFMQSLSRAKVKKLSRVEIELVTNEIQFSMNE